MARMPDMKPMQLTLFGMLELTRGRMMGKNGKVELGNAITIMQPAAPPRVIYLAQRRRGLGAGWRLSCFASCCVV